MRTQTKSYIICGLSKRIQFLLILLVGCCIVLSEVEKTFNFISEVELEILDYNAEEGEKESKEENLKEKNKLDKITSSFKTINFQYHLTLNSSFMFSSYGSDSFLEPPYSPPDLLS